jgi:hypothetical protein
MTHLSDVPSDKLSRPCALCVRRFRSVKNGDTGLNGGQRRTKLMGEHRQKLFLVMLSLFKAMSRFQKFGRRLPFFKVQHGMFR